MAPSLPQTVYTAPTWRPLSHRPLKQLQHGALSPTDRSYSSNMAPSLPQTAQTAPTWRPLSHRPLSLAQTVSPQSPSLCFPVLSPPHAAHPRLCHRTVLALFPAYIPLCGGHTPSPCLPQPPPPPAPVPVSGFTTMGHSHRCSPLC
uniref:Uncharacterized protein n=1 Tax=Knipowitschia caucasica TaxID=637954 RepID=A0AAV2J781_KNICA